MKKQRPNRHTPPSRRPTTALELALKEAFAAKGMTLRPSSQAAPPKAASKTGARTATQKQKRPTVKAAGPPQAPQNTQSQQTSAQQPTAAAARSPRSLKTKKPSRARPPSPADQKPIAAAPSLASELARRMRPYLERLEAEAATADRGIEVSHTARDDLFRRLDLMTPHPAPQGRPVDAVLGFDFGTSSVKIVARLPYEGGAAAVAVEVPEFARAEGHPHLWTSRLWLTPAGDFSLVPEPEAVMLCGIKAALMASDSDRHIVLRAGTIAVTAHEAATAFVSLLLRFARGWLLDTRPEFAAANLRWSYNIGFPAASLDDTSLATRYQRCCAAAIELSQQPGPLTAMNVRTVLQGTYGGRLMALQGALVPEIAAAVASFANSPRRQDGLYAMVDVGAGTLDCCTFNLFPLDGALRCPIFLGDVTMLGVQPWRACAAERPLEREFETEVRRRQTTLLWQTRVRRYREAPHWMQGLPLFLIGGGAASEPHRRTTESLNAWLRSNIPGSSGVRVLDLPPPESLIHCADAMTLHRLSVAIGLSLPIDDIPEVELPHQIEDDVRRVRDLSANYVGAENV